jgi:drug/metabolite transporter (DMT)-like permease
VAPGFTPNAPIAAAPAPLSRGRARLEFFASSVLFAVMAVTIRAASSGPRGFSPGQIGVIRFGVGMGLLLGIFRARGGFRPVSWGLLVARGVLGGTAAVLYFKALALLPAGEATLLNNLSPLLAIPLAYFTLRERPTLHLAIGVGLASAGVFLVLGGGTAQLHLGWGELVAVGSAVLSAGAGTAIRAARATDNALTVFSFFCACGLLVSWPFALGPWPTSPVLWGVALLMALSSFAAQILMTHAYGSVTVPESAIWLEVNPVAAYVLGLVFLGERTSALGAAGVVVAMAGVSYAAIFGRAPASPQRPAAARADLPADPGASP